MKRILLLGGALSLLVVNACDDGGASASGSKSAAAGDASSAASGSAGADAPKVPGATGIAEAHKAVHDDPKKYDGKTMKVSGVMAKHGTQTAGPKGKKSTTHYIELRSSANAKEPRVICQVGKDEPKVKVGDAVAAEGKVRLNKMGGKDGGTVYLIELQDCKVL